jgi:hypothetical protein
MFPQLIEIVPQVIVENTEAAEGKMVSEVEATVDTPAEVRLIKISLISISISYHKLQVMEQQQIIPEITKTNTITEEKMITEEAPTEDKLSEVNVNKMSSNFRQFIRKIP